MLGTYKEIYLHHPPNPPPNISSLNHLVKNNPGECKAWVTATTTECERISEWDGNHTSRTEKQNEPGRSKINVFLINNRRNLSRQGHVGLSLEVRIHNFSCRSRLLQAGPAQRRIKKGRACARDCDPLLTWLADANAATWHSEFFAIKAWICASLNLLFVTLGLPSVGEEFFFYVS